MSSVPGAFLHEVECYRECHIKVISQLKVIMVLMETVY